MDMDCKISVIVPTYNIENEITRCVESILRQTYQNLEIILVNDGSTDGTLNVLQELSQRDPRIRVINKSNEGVTRARLDGVKAATGDWIGFVDGDDYVEPMMFETLLENVYQYDADISHCGYQMVFPSRVDYYYNTGRVVQQDHITGLKDLLIGAFIEPGLCNKLFKRDLFKKIIQSNAMNLEIRNNEDLLMNFYLFREAKRSVFIDRCFYHYIVRPCSAATGTMNEHKLSDPIKVRRIIYGAVSTEPELSKIMEEKIAETLISLSTMPISEDPDLIKRHRAAARKELREMLPGLLGEKHSKRTKILAAWAALWPWSYCAVHKIYAHIRGSDKKYEVS